MRIKPILQRNTLSAYAFISAIGIAAFSAIFVFYIEKKRIREQVIFDYQSIKNAQSFQGLLFDTTGTMSLLCSLIESDGTIHVTSIKVKGSEQPIEKQFQNSNRDFVDIFFMRVESSFTYEGEEISVGMALSYRKLYSPAFFGFTLGFLVILIIGIDKHIQEKNRKLREASRVEYLSKKLAHDIRSPVAALQFLAKINRQHSEEERLLVQSALARVSKIAIDYAKNSADRLAVSMTRVSLDSVHRLIVSIIKETESQEGHDVRFIYKFKIEAQNFIEIELDELELSRIVSNLFNNAIESAASSVLVRTKIEDRYFQINIIDDGVGMNEELIKDILANEEPISTKKDGMGLGLFSALKTLNEWNGKISIASNKPNKGISINILFPLA